MAHPHMLLAQKAVRLAHFLRWSAPASAALDIDLSTLAPPEPAIGMAQLLAPPAEPVDARGSNPWRTQPCVRYRP